MAKMDCERALAILNNGMNTLGIGTIDRRNFCGNWSMKQLKTWTDLELTHISSELSQTIRDKATPAPKRAMLKAVKDRVTKIRIDRLYPKVSKDGKKNSKC